VGFEPTIAVLERAKTVRASDRSTTAIGILENTDREFIDEMLRSKQELPCVPHAEEDKSEVETVECLIFSSWIDGLTQSCASDDDV
jgi:hypothetical protein